MLDRFVKFFWKNPPFALCFSFLITIFSGTVFLMLPWASANGNWTPFINALFTATSGVCVTGHIVTDTATYWSVFGQIVIMILFQIGGLGIMSAGAFFSLVIGKELTGPQREAMKSVLDTKVIEVTKIVRFIILATLWFEISGFGLLLLRQSPFQAGFHAVSAFNNAGFSLITTSFIKYQADFFFNLVITGLIIFGGFGFLVLINLYEVFSSWLSRKEKIKKKISLHSKLVLITSLILISVGTLLFGASEIGNFPDFPLGTKILVSYFQSVTARTAGFNTISIADLKPATKLTLMFLMFVGGAPGSTAGGVKITTFVLVILTVFSLLKGKEDIEVLGRRISWSTVKKSFSIILISLGILFVFSLALLSVENAKFENLLFEAFSAFGTVGLSTCATSQFTRAGKILIIILMYIGRLGPLTLAALLTKGKITPKKGYPEGRVEVG